MGCGSSAAPKNKYGAAVDPAPEAAAAAPAAAAPAVAAAAAPAKDSTAAAPAKDSTAAPVTEAATVAPVKEESTAIAAEEKPTEAAATVAPVKEETTATAVEEKPTESTSPKVVRPRSSLSVDFDPTDGSERNSEKRRPSLSSASLVDAPEHEGHALAKEPPTPEHSDRQSTVQTKMELWWMEDIPALYGVSDSDELRDEIQEDGQADMVKQCISASIEDVPALLKGWLHDCPDQPGLERLITKVIPEVQVVQLAVLSRGLSGKVQFADSDSEAGRPCLKRKGTGFVTAGQVRGLMAQDFGSSSEEESDEDQDDEEFERGLAEKLEKSSHSSRAAVAAEAHEVDDDWVPPVYEKTPAQRARIAEAVSDSFMFQALSNDQLQPLLDAFQEMKVEPGTKVIEEGCLVGPHDRGLYVFESGEMDVYKKGKEAAVFTYTEIGQNFGEIALLYNAPRSATVIATKPSVLWCIDRMTFNVLVKDAAKKAKDRRFHFLKSVELLKTLTDDEVAKIGDALRERTYGSGVHIIEEGTEGDVFFILETGMAAAIKHGSRVMEYRPSDYFGELALLKDAPRAADIITQEDCTVLSLNRSAFQRLLGPLDSIMSERMAQYDEADMVKNAAKRESGLVSDEPEAAAVVAEVAETPTAS